MIPKRLKTFRQTCLVLEGVVKWKLLRKWSLSEVYRASLPTGEHLIVKWCGNEMAREVGIYRDLLIPLQIKCPLIYEYHEGEQGSLLLMEDAGRYNLEQQPSVQHFLEAARELARLRHTATTILHSDVISKETIDTYTVSDQKYRSQLNDLIKVHDHPILHKTKHLFPKHLKRIYQEVPFTLVHHDYHAKNLLIQGNHIIPVDWSNAYLSPHLGDLYCLIQEAHFRCGLDKDTILLIYHQEIGSDTLDFGELKQRVNIGGICWLIRSLRWLVYGGTKTIPGSTEWIPDLMTDVHTLLESLEED